MTLEHNLRPAKQPGRNVMNSLEETKTGKNLVKSLRAMETSRKDTL